MTRNALLHFSTIAVLLSACAPGTMEARSDTSRTASASAPAPPEAEATPTAPTPTPQVTATVTQYGPEAESFPADLNPMTGLPVIDPELMKIPAVLISISHFPPTGRPQAGLSFAPFVYEFSITRGETRFLAAFYGQFPEPEVPVSGDCDVRSGAFRQASTIVGNLVWLDADRNGAQDPGEKGIPGVCVRLLDEDGDVLQTTTTDTNGIYGFNADADGTYALEFGVPAYLELTRQDRGYENLDSDVDPTSRRTGTFQATQDVRDWDAGMFLNGRPLPAEQTEAVIPRAEVGPVRSGRLLYAYLAQSYTNSCLIYAFAAPEILEKLPRCAFVAHEQDYGGAMISVERMRAVAEDMMRRTARRPFDYSSNVYSETPPLDGAEALRLDVFFSNINQSAWIYDPLYQAYLRQVDNADINARGVLHADVDRLTGRQIHFENVIVVMADTEVVTRTNLDIHLEAGNSGPAKLFRNGGVFPITWSTRGGEYEQRTGFRKPIHFLNDDGSPAPLKPGHTWVIIVTPFSRFEAQSNGAFLVQYAPPAGEAQ